MADDGFLAGRIDSGAWPLAVADLVALVVVFTGGAMRHNGPTFPVDLPAEWLLTILPFLLGWALVGPLVGVYSAGAAESAKAAIPLAIRAWVPAAAVALALRSLAFEPGPIVPIFALITLVTGAVGLSLARWLRFRF